MRYEVYANHQDNNHRPIIISRQESPFLMRDHLSLDEAKELVTELMELIHITEINKYYIELENRSIEEK